MVSTQPLISNSASPFNNPLVMVPKPPITIGIIVTFVFHSFFNSRVSSRYWFFFSVYFCVQLGQQSPQFCKFSFLLLRSGLLAKIRWFVCMSKSHRSLCVSFSRTDAGSWIYDLLVWSNLNFSHISQWITFPTMSCLLFHSLSEW